MAESDNNTSGGVTDPLKMRNTETAALKRIPASPNSASASSAARKTIKLKPLMPSASSASSASSDGSVGTETRSVAPPSILVNMRKPAVAPAEAAPKFMSTNTAPIGKMAKPEAEKPIPAATLQTEPAPTKTVSIPRLQARAPKAAPAAAPAATPPVSTVTAAVPKIVKPAAPAAAAAGGTPPVSTVTAAVPKIVKPAAPAAAAGGTPPVSTVTAGVPRIVKPGAAAAPAAAGGTPPVSTVTAGVPKIVKPGAAAAPAATNTQGIQKQAIDQAKMQSGLQGAKPAIKLRPSASPTQDPSVLTPASPTIKLAPKTESAVSPVPPSDPAAEPASGEQAAPAASDDVTVTAKIPRKTLQLKPKMPASSGAQLREQGDIANQQINSGVDEGDQTIQQSLDLEKKDEASEGNAPLNNSAADAGKNEPNIIFSICAILAFLVIGYTVFALAAQFVSTWQGKQIPVVGFEQISQSAKK